MRKLVIVSALLGLALAVPGCKKKEEGGEAPPSGDTAAAPTGTDDAKTAPAGEADKGDSNGAADSAAAMRNNMKHCPNAVEGAETSVEKTDKGVNVIITDKDAAKLAEIKERADHIAEVAGKPEPDVKHTGQGTGGGAEGKCPVGVKNTKVSVTAGEDGTVTVLLEPLEGMTIDELFQTVVARKNALDGVAKPAHEHGSGTGGGTGGGGGKGMGDKDGHKGAETGK